jgi:hypothetical protein
LKAKALLCFSSLFLLRCGVASAMADQLATVLEKEWEDMIILFVFPIHLPKNTILLYTGDGKVTYAEATSKM